MDFRHEDGPLYTLRHLPTTTPLDRVPKDQNTAPTPHHERNIRSKGVIYNHLDG